MIQINKNLDPEVEIFDPSGKSIGKVCSDTEFADLRAQIAEHQAEGYTFEFNGNIYDIRSCGGVDYWEKGLYDANTSALTRILVARGKMYNNDKK